MPHRPLAPRRVKLPKLSAKTLVSLFEAADFEVRRGIEFLNACASAMPFLNGDLLPLDATAPGEGHYGFTRHVPYGIVAGITPFNAPVNLLLQKVGPAIAAGNAIIVKPAPAGARAAVQLARLFQA